MSMIEQSRIFRERFKQVEDEIGKVIVGQPDVVRGVLTCLFCGGHVLLEGVPGLGKTLLVRTLASVLDLKFSRVQFTPDLMPSDILGTNIITENDGKRAFSFQAGPIFAQILLADEINRATPKTQSALLEAMQEHQVTAAGTRYVLDEPFFVLATQNPIEMEGTYPLPEAQLDRFMFNVVIDYLPEDEEVAVVSRTTSGASEPIQALFTGQDIQQIHALVRKVPVAEDVVRFAVRLAAASRPKQPHTPDFINDWVSWGAGLRAAQYLILGGKARALLSGRANVTWEDIRVLARPVLRHRILINYRAEAAGQTVENIITRLLETVKDHDSGSVTR